MEMTHVRVEAFQRQWVSDAGTMTSPRLASPHISSIAIHQYFEGPQWPSPNSRCRIGSRIQVRDKRHDLSRVCHTSFPDRCGL